MSESKTSFKICLALLSLLMCLACNHKPVTVVNRGKSFYGKHSSYNKDKYRNLGKRTSGVKLKDREIQVVAGETIYSISKKYQTPLRDLIKQNNLTPPYKLSPGALLIIPIPAYHEVVAGDTVYSIAHAYKMNVDSLVLLNDLRDPYQLETGQRIKVSRFANNAAVDPAEASSNKNNSSHIEETESSSPGFVEKTLDKLNHFSWPLRGEIISQFGPKSGGLYNDGINIKAAEGDMVKVSEDGTVSYAGNELKGYGNLVIVKHSGGWITAYAHLSKISVKRGQVVGKLTKIGEVGSTGNVTSPQLYFGLRKGRDAVNPENHLSK